jgi:hypothetical protein
LRRTPTPTPWLTYRSKPYRYSIKYPPGCLAKGRVAYFLDVYGKNEAAVADRALFKRMYTTWRPT